MSAKEEDGKVPLQLAIAKDNSDLVRVLLVQHASLIDVINTPDNTDVSAKQLAENLNYSEILMTLETYTDSFSTLKRSICGSEDKSKEGRHSLCCAVCAVVVEVLLLHIVLRCSTLYVPCCV